MSFEIFLNSTGIVKISSEIQKKLEVQCIINLDEKSRARSLLLIRSMKTEFCELKPWSYLESSSTFMLYQTLIKSAGGFEKIGRHI